MRDRRLRQDAVAEIENVGPRLEALEARDRFPRRGPRRPPTSASGSRLPCRAIGRGRAAMAARGSTAVSRPIAATPGTCANFSSCVAAPRGKSDDRSLRRFGAHLGDQGRYRPDAPALEFSRRQHPGPRIRRSAQLPPPPPAGAARYSAEASTRRSISAENKLRMAIGEQPRRRLIGRAAPGDHVARDRPGRAAKADQRDIAGQCGFQPVERLEHGRELRASRARRGASRGRPRPRSDRAAGLRRSRRRPPALARRG